jgi:hypothetical protein
LEAIVLERSTTAALARERIRESRLTSRIEVREGDFLEDLLPAECDMVLLANVLSMLTTETNRVLIGRVFDALAAGGIIVLSGWMTDESGSRGSLLPLLLSLEDILLNAPDVEHSAVRYADWLRAAGFESVAHAAYFEPASLVIGRKPHRA